MIKSAKHTWLYELPKRPEPTEQMVIMSYQGKYLSTFRSIKVAAKVTGIDSADIINCCMGSRKSAGGYEWAYREVAAL